MPVSGHVWPTTAQGCVQTCSVPYCIKLPKYTCLAGHMSAANTDQARHSLQPCIASLTDVQATAAGPATAEMGGRVGCEQAHLYQVWRSEEHAALSAGLLLCIPDGLLSNCGVAACLHLHAALVLPAAPDSKGFEPPARLNAAYCTWWTSRAEHLALACICSVV
jgi:hypothetical protein